MLMYPARVLKEMKRPSKHAVAGSPGRAVACYATRAYSA